MSSNFRNIHPQTLIINSKFNFYTASFHMQFSTAVLHGVSNILMDFCESRLCSQENNLCN